MGRGVQRLRTRAPGIAVYRRPKSARKRREAMNRLCEVLFCAIAVGLCSVTHSSATPAPADQQVTVKQFVIEGADSLSTSQIEEFKSSVMGRPESAEVLLDTARHRLTAFLNSYCYIRNVKVHPLVQANKATEQFDLTLYIDEGK